MIKGKFFETNSYTHTRTRT